ncbi:MAG TPA: MFS transporter [Candidatus Elarobacter sp.]|nr:MFS transporter [Candidatus Elarobacter sp.]
MPGTDERARSRRALAAAASYIILTSNSTASSAVFVAYRQQWGLSPGDVALAFSVYVGTLIPVLLIFGGHAERYGRRLMVGIGTGFMLAGTLSLLLARGFPELIVARLSQGIGAALAVGVMSATFTEAYRGKIVAGQALAVVTAFALAGGPVVTALAYDLGGGTNLSYLPMLILGILAVGLLPFFESRPAPAGVATVEPPLPVDSVRSGLLFAMPMVFVAWAGTALYLSLVPSYLAAAIHVSDPLVGAGAFVATQLATVVASIRFGNVAPQRSGPVAAAGVVVGLVLLVWGTHANSWWLIGIATLVVGGSSGVASGASFGVAGLIGRGQRARVFARLLVAAYAGYSLPSLITGIIASRTSFLAGFATTIAILAVIAAATPLFRARAESALRHAARPAPIEQLTGFD